MWSTFFFNTGQAISTVYEMWQRLIKCLPLLKVKVKSLSHVQLFATPWTVAYQAPPSMEFSRQECIGRTYAEAEVPILWPPDMKSQLIGKDPGAGKD